MNSQNSLRCQLQRSHHAHQRLRNQSDGQPWPWYSRIPGVSGLLQSDVNRARIHLNLSDWSSKLAEGSDEAQASLNGICEELRTDSMPLAKYRWLHRNAALSPAEVKTVCGWTAAAKSR